MKKISLYIMALLSTGLASCNQDFETIFSPQTNEPESLLQTSDVSVSSTTPSAISIAEYIDADGMETPIPIGTVSVKEGAMPANTILKAEVEFAKDADFNNSITIDANSMENSNLISIQPSLLQDAYFNAITRNPATTDMYIRTVLYTVTGGTAEAIVGKPGENYYAENTVKFTPLNKVQISPAYYVIGAAAGWSADGARTQKFNQSGADVYEDPIFSIVVDAGGDDCWFAIGDDAALDAIANDNDWTKLLGTKGASEDLKGTMDYRYNLGGDHSFHVTGAKKIKITLNMLEYSYTIEPINVADAYYLVGGPMDWAESASSKAQKFSHSSASVADDPVFTYILEGTGGDIWFAIGDDEACDAIANENDWSKLFGTTSGNGENGLSGSLSRRSSLSDDGSFKVDGTSKFIRIQINMAEMTYTITPLDFDPYVYFIGATDGWANAEQKLALTDETGIYTGYLYVADPNSWGLEFKFQKVAGDWDSQLNSNNLTDISGGFAKGDDNIKAVDGEGVYYVTLDMASLTLNAVKIENMNLVGDFNGWNQADDAQQMTWDAENYCFVIENAGVTANGWKFTTNNSWDINLGGTIGNLWANGDNLTVEGKTIKLYPTRKDNDNIYCTVE